MPITPSKNLQNAEIEILKLVNFIYGKDGDALIEQFFMTSSLLNLSQQAKKEPNSLSQTLLAFYGYFFSICQRLRLSKQQSLAQFVGLKITDLGESIDPDMITVNSIGELIRQSLQPFMGLNSIETKKILQRGI